MCVNMCVSVVCMCVYVCVHVLSIFHIAGKVGRGKFDDFDESFVIYQTKNHPNLVLTIISNYLFSCSNNLLNFFCQMFDSQTFPLYSIALAVESSDAAYIGVYEQFQ